MASGDSELAVVLELRGELLTNLEEWSIESSYLSAADAFSVVVYDDQPARLGDLRLEPVTLIVSGNTQLVGRIEVTVRGSRGTAIECSGRDYLGDLIECNVDPKLSIKDGTSLGDAILEAFGPVGIAKVLDEREGDMRRVRTGRAGENERVDRHKAKPQGDYKPTPGEGLIEFGARLAGRNGATIQPGPDRKSVVIEAPDYDQPPMATLRRSREGRSNNMISGVATEDFTTCPSHVLVHGLLARHGEGSRRIQEEHDVPQILERFPASLRKRLSEVLVPGRIKPEEAAALEPGKLYRLLFVKDDEARNAEQLTSTRDRALGDRLKETLSYEVTLRGHTDPDSGAVWAVNTMISVDDEITGLKEPLWVCERNLSYARTGGALTRLRLWRPGTFMVESR